MDAMLSAGECGVAAEIIGSYVTNVACFEDLNRVEYPGLVAVLANLNLVGPNGPLFATPLNTKATDFSDVLTIAKIYNLAGGPDASAEQLRATMLGFTGDAILFGEQDCSLLTNSPAASIGLAHSQSCAKFVDVGRCKAANTSRSKTSTSARCRTISHDATERSSSTRVPA
jgi:hypothetical protein